MFAKILAVAAAVACVQAGVFELQPETQHTATSYSSLSKQITKVAPVAQVAHVAPVAHYAPVSHITHVSHVAPIAHVAHVAPVAHVAHVAPVAHVAHVAPVAHVAHVAHVAPVAHVAHVAHVAPVAHVAHVAPVKTEVYADSHPQYSFEYGVKDTHTNDIKNQQEQRNGDVVKGSYSLLQPDGVTRTVHYSADDHNGFNAQVEYSGHAAHPQKVAKAVLAAPVYH